jgi:hypothetical protein
MREYTEAVGGKINYSKTEGILFGEPDNGIFSPIIEWKYPKDSIKYLGITFGDDGKDKWKALIENIKKEWTHGASSTYRTLARFEYGTS